jgi:hypothetical protein
MDAIANPSPTRRAMAEYGARVLLGYSAFEAGTDGRRGITTASVVLVLAR